MLIPLIATSAAKVCPFAASNATPTTYPGFGRRSHDRNEAFYTNDNDPGWLAKRHGLGHEVEAPVSGMAAALAAVARAATASP
jgi:hypothetical protein